MTLCSDCRWSLPHYFHSPPLHDARSCLHTHDDHSPLPKWRYYSRNVNFDCFGSLLG
uniref:Uncharacterized protein n=1 Tax=Rhizophora mucronata TaxID=61149 RepID=A0A2P2QZ62_RHIMU